jgi:GT2 family glycosyltransferase
LAHPEVQVAVAHARYVLEPDCRVPPGFRPELLEGSHPGAMETLVARKGAFGLVGSFDRGYRTGEDLDWIARVRDAGVGLVRMSDVLLIKHIHDSNISLKFAEDNRLILRLLRDSIARKRRAE